MGGMPGGRGLHGIREGLVEIRKGLWSASREDTKGDPSANIGKGSHVDERENGPFPRVRFAPDGH